MIDNRVSEVMGRKRINVSELARGAGISRNAAHALYHATNRQVDLDVLDRVCLFLGVQVGDLFVYIRDDEEGQE